MGVHVDFWLGDLFVFSFLFKTEKTHNRNGCDGLVPSGRVTREHGVVSTVEGLREVVTDVSVKINLGVDTPSTSSVSSCDTRFIACVLEGDSSGFIFYYNG